LTLHWELLRWAGRSIPVAWLLWAAVWVVLALRAKPAVRREGLGSRLAFSLRVALSMLLLLRRSGHSTRPRRLEIASAAWPSGL